MSDEQTEDIDPQDENLLAKLLGPLADDEAAMDRAAMERAHRRAGEEFVLVSGGPLLDRAGDSPLGAIAYRNERRATLGPMLVAVVVLVGVIGLFLNSNGLASGKETLGEVLDRALDSESLTLRVTVDGKSADVWVKPEGEVRWQESATKYVIAKGSRLWRVDEAENSAEPAESAWYRADAKRVDLLGLIGVGERSADMLRMAKPRGEVQHAGRKCRVYRVPVRDDDRRLTVEAFADARTGELLTIAAWPRGEIDRTEPPLAELTLVASNQPIDESKFIVAKWLSADGRIGKIADSQGIVTVKPVMRDRWTPVTGSMLLRPGDWVRTDVRGANAVAIQLAEGTRLTLGPGSLIEMMGPKQARLLRGEVQVESTEGSGFLLTSPDGEQRTSAEKQLLRVRGGRFQLLKHVPVWLAGFEGTQSNESLGSLIANVDGRNVPLTVGYHNVTVEIRDQIARTTIEESFVNHTDSRLEGVFYFPLPQDASISGFGMWIGNELVEADVVEKQRAREIYETIRRENRDPALLEWTGGNIFKASVFPIFANSEKRVKITYTQVLPVRSGRYRYSYGLRSEMLKQKPLRELSIDLQVYSALPLKEIACPTHAARTDKTVHAGHVEFTAQQSTPDRDFEVVVDIDGRQSDVVVIPHQRGDDGYFMLQLTPPSAAGNWQRELLPDGEPLDLILVADTSASMDAENRQQQSLFISSLLASLGPEDRFNLAAADVKTVWAFQKSQTADEKSVRQAQGFLDERVSLGWTDLDAMVRAVLQKVGKRTHVVYVGDGIVTAGSAEPTDFVHRLERLVQGRDATFHAVTVGSSFEPVVLKAIAAIGGGSLRQITGDAGPQGVALELMNEIAQPGLRDLRVEINGVRVARVYPDNLPNIAAGSQQIIIGRYLPEGREQTGEVVVTGMRGNEKVKYKARFELADAERGNSFIPRLWARLHLDHLLGQGSSAEIRDDIIALSEEYHIITPYTSLLVLESDADRERFKVKRRFQMRDGEKFFAEGRDNANFELKQKQMKLAGLWRLALRRRILKQFATLGRDVSLLGSASGRQHRGGQSWGFGLGGGGASGKQMLGINGTDMLSSLNSLITESASPAKEIDFEDARYQYFSTDDLGNLDPPDDAQEFIHDDMLAGDATPSPIVNYDSDSVLQLLVTPRVISQSRDRTSVSGNGLPALYSMDPPFFGEQNFATGFSLVENPLFRFHVPLARRADWIGELFPHVPAVAVPRKPVESKWPPEAVALSKSLLRVDALRELKGGLRVMSASETLDVRWNRITSQSGELVLYSPGAWLSQPQSAGVHPIVNFCDGTERGAYSLAFGLGRIRKAVESDLQPIPIGLSDHSLSPLHETYSSLQAAVEKVDDNRSWLVLTRPASKTLLHLLIDTERQVVLEFEWRVEDKVTRKTTFGQFVEVGGRHWAQRVEFFNGKGERISWTDWKIESLTAQEYAKAYAEELSDRDGVQFLPLELPKLAEAREATVNERGSFADHAVMLQYFLQTQQWKRVDAHLKGMEALAAGKPGMRWLRDLYLRDSRQFEDLRQRMQKEGARLVQQASPADLFLAKRVLAFVQQFASASEQLGFIDQLRPVFERQPEYLAAMKYWLERRAEVLASLDRIDELVAVRKRLATEFQWSHESQVDYASALVSFRGDYPSALKWLRAALRDRAKWREWQEESIRGAITDRLQQQGRYAELLRFTTEWVGLEPGNSTAYDRHLSALIWNDDVETVEKLVQLWLSEAVTAVSGVKSLAEVVAFPDRNERQLLPQQLARLNSAIGLATGNGYNGYANRVEPRWLQPLSRVMIAFARSRPHHSIAMQIMQRGQFNRSDESIVVRRMAIQLLREELEAMEPWEIDLFLDWTIPGPLQTDQELWVELAGRLEAMWAGEKEDDKKHAFGASLSRLLSARFDAEVQLKFLRRQLAGGPKEHRVEYANQVFTLLLQQHWRDEYEAEAFGLLWKLSDAKEPGDRLMAVLPKLYQLTDRMLQSRYDAGLAEVDPETKANRVELRKKQQELWKEARSGYAGQLKRQMELQPEPLRKWLRVEAVYVDIRLERNLDETVRLCRRVLGEIPPKIAAEGESFSSEKHLDGVLRHRYLVTASYLATRKETHEAISEFVLNYIDAGIEQTTVGADDAEDDESSERAALVASNQRWKAARYQLLIALDRPEELEQDLRRWIAADRRASPWRLSLGRLLAEQGRLQEAVRLYEAVEHDDELTPPEYRALSDWQMALNQREEHDAARLAYYKTMNEYQIRRMISVHRNMHQRTDGTAPAHLDDEVLLMIRAIFEKSDSPQNYLWEVGQLYASTHDFRLLESLPYAVIGQTAGKIYRFLGNVISVTSQIRDEATVDSIVEHLEDIRKEAKSDVDRRALDLLTLLAERRAAELQNQSAPHVEATLKAMRRAFADHAWAGGEQPMMAEFLAGLGQISQGPLVDEQLKQLRQLHGWSESGTFARLQIASQIANLIWGYGRRDEALRVFEAAIAVFSASEQGRWPQSANGILDQYLGLLESAGQYAAGEMFIREYLTRPGNESQSDWFEQRLDTLYQRAYDAGARVSLGQGAELYRKLQKRLLRDVADANESRTLDVINRLTQLYRSGKRQNVASLHADVETFAFELMPNLLKQTVSNYRSAVSTTAELVHDVLGPARGISFLVERIENEPSRLRYRGDYAWSHHAGQLATWRHETKSLDAELSRRLLKIVTAELRRDLITREQLGRYLYSAESSYFWDEQKPAFLKTAEDVLAERSESGESATYIAWYVFHGLRMRERAIEMMFAAYRAKRLNDGQVATLVQFLVESKQWGQTIALLEPLSERHASNLTYRTQLMRAYFYTKQSMALQELLAQTDMYFHMEGRWSESVMAELGKVCYETELFEQAVKYFGEAISHHQRTQPNRGIGSGTLSYYFASQANAYQKLNKTPEAVDAAAGAIVSWGRDQKQRQEALNTLTSILKGAADRDAYASFLDEEAERTGEERPIVRTALGKAYHDLKQFDRAVGQLEIAVRFQPNDQETHELLIACYDAQQDRAAVIDQLLALSQLNRRDETLYQRLGERFQGDDAQQERAYTSIVEMKPHESESHAALATIRQKQNRWDEALRHWQQVARIRSLEPTGLLNAADAQIRLGRWDAARGTLDELEEKRWPPRFGDVRERVRVLRERVRGEND